MIQILCYFELKMWCSCYELNALCCNTAVPSNAPFLTLEVKCICHMVDTLYSENSWSTTLQMDIYWKWQQDIFASRCIYILGQTVKHLLPTEPWASYLFQVTLHLYRNQTIFTIPSTWRSSSWVESKCSACGISINSLRPRQNDCYFPDDICQMRFFSCDQAALQMVFAVRLSVCHTFLTMFPSSYHHEIFRSYYQWPK